MFPNNYVYPHYERKYADRDPLTSFCAAIGECQQKFLLGGAFYSPNERLLPPITQCDISGWTVNAMYTFGSSHILFMPGMTRSHLISK